MSKQKSKQEPKELNQDPKEGNQESNPDPNKIPHPRLRPNTKRTGERSEAAFLHKASSLGFGVARPWGDSERYDFILDNGRQLLRIQTKATNLPPRPRLRNPRHLLRRQRTRRLHPPRHRLPGRPHNPAGCLVHPPRRNLHPAADAAFLPPPPSQKNAPGTIPRSLAPDAARRFHRAKIWPRNPSGCRRNSVCRDRFHPWHPE